jgi:nucleoid DNA-binding protein
MKRTTDGDWTLSRRTLLYRTGAGAVLLGTGLATLPGSALALKKAELLEAVTSATTSALKKGDRVALVGFGAFSISKRSARTGRNPQREGGPREESPVRFEACPEFAAGLDLIPGNGDVRRSPSASRCRDADIVIDATRIADDTARNRDSGLSKADAKRALDAFVETTTTVLNEGDSVVLDGFGSFSISKRSARTGRNPQTGREQQSQGKNEVKFKAGAELSKAVN